MIRRIWVIFLTGLVCQILGCGSQYQVNPAQKSDIPDFAGTWRSQPEQEQWDITIDPNGTVVSAVYPMGTTIIRPNQTSTIEMYYGKKSVFEAGDFFAKYSHSERFLSVSIEVKKIEVHILDQSIRGYSIDTFSGPISQDGITWNATRVRAFDFGPQLQMGEGEEVPMPFPFKKIKPWPEKVSK